MGVAGGGLGPTSIPIITLSVITDTVDLDSSELQFMVLSAGLHN